MARAGLASQGMFGNLSELKQRILFVLGAMVVFRIGAHVPVPGVDPTAIAALFEQTKGSIVQVFNMFFRWCSQPLVHPSPSASCPTSRPPSSCR